ncbi:NAD(P)/FAD-dependent oxidoreductase [Williamsia sp. CHRR-6]|uniref:flavin-containing monooxygenase n=1 Tax=Williamsia sp. CHRR-6 TaxID=2835871 RepID=UPI001BDA09C3|nr:NAD(P)/FAD-dependent oxidoreductase [Williamsia sp. CHRR-6]MBT0567511.1 NAD(P)/FAD-dependent oxidoreductase [Williamsia sp. CHRR-6]
MDVKVEVPDHEVVIVGGGFSGIGAAIMLDRAGFSDYLLVEDGAGLGGAWHWNTYPGVGVDIPSFSYQFSFEQRGDWSRVYAPGRELKAYAEHCVRRYGVDAHTRLNTRITDAVFDEGTDIWHLTTSAGDAITARHVIGATGVLTQPKPPAIPGLDDYAGTVMHTARWDHSVALTGKRVAIIGTGASAVQVIPAIAPDVSHLTVFQRTPIWCLPKPDAAIPTAARLVLERIPGLKRAVRTVSQSFVELHFPLPAHYNGVVPIAGVGAKLGLRHLGTQVRDPQVREKLTPRYALGCKRPSFSNTYLATFNRDNVTLETTAIEAITPTGVRTADGTEHGADVLILATGFKVFERGNMPPFPVAGRGGVELEEFWEANRFQAFQGVSVPGFPNFFTILGPYGYNGSSYFNLIETQVNHILRVLRHARSAKATRAEVTERANAEYLESMLSRRKNQVFFAGGCGGANSYYFDAHGDVPFRASSTLETMWTSRRFPIENYQFSG